MSPSSNSGSAEQSGDRSSNNREPAAQHAAVSNSEYKYWAFISYSHSDEHWAQWLHKELETYRVPRRLVGRRNAFGEVPRRVFPVFRDREELPGAFDLGSNLTDALRLSRNLIVICSPRSATSHWVNEEIKLYKSMGREDRVLCLIVDGEPNASDRPELGLAECFPPALRFRVGSDGELTEVRNEPIAADARKGKDGRENSKLKLLAGVLGVGYDELKQRELRRVRRRRLKLAASIFASLLLVSFLYLVMADKGLAIPGGEAVRTVLDRHDSSVLRPAKEMPEIQSAVVPLRRQLFDTLASNRTDDHWIKATIKSGNKLNIETWSHSQALFALFRVPEATHGELRGLLPCLEAPFAPGVAVEKNGVKYGWISHSNDTDTLAEPALWTTAALAAALSRPNLLDASERERLLARLAYTQEVLRLYRPLDNGGWNMFPRQKEADDANPYTTTLALLTLLELRRAGVGWEGSASKRDELLEKTAQWLVDNYDTTTATPGWHGTGEGAFETFDGLTLQIYSLLLRAEDETGFQVPPVILAEIPRHLARINARDFDFPIGRAEFSAICVDHENREYTGKEGVGFLWHPWATDCAVRWLRWAEQNPVAPEDRVRVRRALGYMVVGMGQEAVRRASNEWTFIPAETLYGFTAVTPR
ncbi:MAG TPA: toll/interleukin-1 receptor domain-containing protein [Pyrinomonadaceae bacterium]|nr:toll/interleukin-1 receptor domain-containing protein [Pyrinomonadaceae bacterium]